MKRSMGIFAAMVALAFVAAKPVCAANLFADDFESYTAGNPISGAPWTTVVGLETARDASTSTVFGNPNKYAELLDPDSTAYIRLQSGSYTGASAVVTTFSFDFCEPAAGGGNAITVGYAMTSADLTSGEKRLAITLDDGTIGGVSGGAATYSLDTAYRLYVVFNDTASSVVYAGGTIAATSAHVWIEPLSGVDRVYVGSATATNSRTSSYRVGFRTFIPNVQALWIDNVSLDEGTPPISARTWTGSTDANWTEAGNWTVDVPTSGGAVVFDGTGGNLNNTLNAAFTLGSLIFTAGQTAAVTINTDNTKPLTFSDGATITVLAGDHTVNGTAGGSGTADDVVVDDTTYSIAAGASLDFSARMGQGSGGSGQAHSKTGDGTLIFSADNGGTGSWGFNVFSINSGAVRFANRLGHSANNVAVASGAALELTGGKANAINDGTVTLNGTGIGDTGALRSLSGNNSITDSKLSGDPGQIVLASASSIGVDANTLTLNKVITGGFSLTKVGAGILLLSATNTYTGLTDVQAGTLTLNSSGGTIADAAPVLVSGGTLNVAQADTVGTVTLSSGTISGVAALTGSSYALTDSGTVSAVLAGSGITLTKSGAGTATLSGVNTYTGLTTVNAGTLALGANTVLDTDNNVILAGGSLDMGTYTNTLGTLDVSGSTTINLGNGSGTLSFSDSSLVDWTGGALALTGTLRASTLRFGTNANGLTTGQLALITIEGRRVILNASGYIRAQSSGTTFRFY